MPTKHPLNFTLPVALGKKACLLALGWLLAFAAAAQDNLEKAKLDIWTETAAFVYRDAKMAEPEAIVNAASMEDFVAAIRKDDAKSSIHSKLYQPIEQTGTYRKGPDDKAKLDLLIKSINSKLRENNQRMADLSRRQRLNDLYKQLQQIASDYTSPAAQAATAGVATAAAPGEATVAQTDTVTEETYADNQLSSVAKKQGATRKPDLVSILALVLGVINLGMIFFLFKGINKLNLRLDQRKKELETLSQQVNGVGGKGTEGNSKLTMSAIESMVQKTLARELGQRQPGTPRTAAPAVAATAPAVTAATSAPAAPVAPAPVPQAPHQTPVPEPEESVQPELANDLPPTPVAGPPQAVAAPAGEPKPEKPMSFFARVPVNGGFHEQDLYPSPQHDSIYEIRVSRKDPNKAAFRIVTNTTVHRSAIESAYLSLKDACNYQMNNQHATRIVTDEPGTLSFQNGFWLIDRKAQVHFE